VSALQSNTSGGENTANGSGALQVNTTGSRNTATGLHALFGNIMGAYNTANGFDALRDNTTGNGNTAIGSSALRGNTTGNGNTVVGNLALVNNTTGLSNTANGVYALYNNTTGGNNTALGQYAGINLTTGDNNIDIGYNVGGTAGESGTIRIGDPLVQGATFIAGISGAAVPGGAPVVVDTSGHLGTIVSSVRFKNEIKPMDKASEAVLALKPVTFRYKKELDPQGIPQFGLVAEEVAKVSADLVACDAKGEVYTVRYEAVNAMLLNEFLKEHRKVQGLEATVAKQQKDSEASDARQREQIQALTARLDEQAAEIQKVSAQIEDREAVARMALNNP
jgi:hypothetical protein